MNAHAYSDDRAGDQDAPGPGPGVDELEHWHKEYGANNFPFHDLTAILKKQWILDFCKEFYARGLHEKVTWQLPSGTRVEVIDDEVAAWLKKTNGVSLNYAPESGSQETRKRVKKMAGKYDAKINEIQKVAAAM